MLAFTRTAVRKTWVTGHKRDVCATIVADLTRSHRRRRFAAVVNPDPALLRVAGLRVLAKMLAKLAEFVGLDGLPPGLGIDAEEPGGVKTEDLSFDLIGQLGVAILI